MSSHMQVLSSESSFGQSGIPSHLYKNDMYPPGMHENVLSFKSIFAFSVEKMYNPSDSDVKIYCFVLVKVQNFLECELSNMGAIVCK